MTKKIFDYFILIFCVVLAVLLHRSTASYPEICQNSTASYVRFLALCLGILSLAQVGINYKKNDNSSVEIYKDKRKFFTLLASLIVYALLISYFGFMLSTALFLPLTMVLMGHKKKITIIYASAGLLLFIQILFVSLLQVPLPEGIIFG